MLKFSIRDIPSTGLSFKKDIQPIDIGLSKEDLDLRSSLSVDVSLTRIDNIVLASGVVSASCGFQCARCLEDFAGPRIRKFHFDYEVKGPMDVIDVGEDIRQEMILAAPLRALCQKDCKGICLKCGANLNFEPCRCNKE